MHNLLSRIWHILLNIQKVIMIVSSAFILISLVTTVLLRYIFQTDLFGLEEITVIAALWMYFIGASYGTHQETHITADLVNVYVQNQTTKKIIRLFNTVVCFVICIVFSIWAFTFVTWTIESGATSTAWNYPLYIPQSALLIGFILMAFYLFIFVIKDIRNLFAQHR